MHVADGALDREAERPGVFLADGLHLGAAVHRLHVQRRLAFEQGAADGVGAGTDVEHFLMRLDIHRLHEALEESAPQAERGDLVGAVVIARDVGEGIVQIVVPEFAEALLAYRLARGQWGGCHAWFSCR
jgi:hypothetical protein